MINRVYFIIVKFLVCSGNPLKQAWGNSLLFSLHCITKLFTCFYSFVFLGHLCMNDATGFTYLVVGAKKDKTAFKKVQIFELKVKKFYLVFSKKWFEDCSCTCLSGLDCASSVLPLCSLCSETSVEQQLCLPGWCLLFQFTFWRLGILLKWQFLLWTPEKYPLDSEYLILKYFRLLR